MVGNGKKYAAPLLVLGCVVFGLGSLIVKSVHVGPYAIAFWRLLISVFVFWFLARFFGQKFPKNRKTVRYALTAGVFLAFDLALWHESIHAVGPGISTLLNSLQIFFLSEPVAALFIDYFGLGKPIEGVQWAGVALTLSAIYLGSLKRQS